MSQKVGETRIFMGSWNLIVWTIWRQIYSNHNMESLIHCFTNPLWLYLVLCVAILPQLASSNQQDNHLYQNTLYGQHGNNILHGYGNNEMSNEIPLFNDEEDNTIPVNNFDRNYFDNFDNIGLDNFVNLEMDPNNPKYAPKYMLELYDKFSKDRYSHPMANTVRSFRSVNADAIPITHTGNNTRIHTLVFNISSINKDEEILLAELRLYTLVEADRIQYLGMDRRVTVSEILLDTEETLLVDSKDIFGRNSGWETFTMTDAVARWVRDREETHVIEVRIDSVFNMDSPIGVDIDTRVRNSNEPLLVLFSNDKRKKKSEQKELHELIMHESDVRDYEDLEEYYYDGEYEDSYDDFDYESEHNRYKRSIDNDIDNEQFKNIDVISKATLSNIKAMNKTVSESQLREHLLKVYSAIYTHLINDTINISLLNKYATKYIIQYQTDKKTEKQHVIHKRGTKRRRKRRRNPCRRKSMRVNFDDINWDGWILAPKGYDAYECTGRCYFPLADHLTPTKHAIIQTMLHLQKPKQASRVCCVPTKLAPISILYVDDQNIVTYKYKYDDMVVAECGCR